MNLFKRIFGKKSEPIMPAEDEKPHKSNAEDEEEEFHKAIETLNKYKRIAYLPKVQANPNTFSTASKIGGFPYLRHELDWPICPNCERNMQLFLQLNLNELPERKEDGLVQLFYCTTSEPLCESDLQAFFPFSKAVCCRRIEIEGESSQTQPNIEELFNEKIIVGWTPVDDYPHAEEFAQLGFDFVDDISDILEERQTGLSIDKDKLFGWPHWVQSVEYPFDRKTGTQMELLFQFDSEDNLPYMFGDGGIAHLTQSPDNKSELGFGWACS